MQKQDNKTIRTVNRQITPAQSELLDFCRHIEAPDLLKSFKLVLESAVFNVINDDKEAMYQTYLLCETLKKLEKEGEAPQLARTA
jgi:hypothetical protein